MTRRLLHAIVFALLVLACAAFVRLNGAAVELDLLFAGVATTTGRALVGAFVLGWLVGLAAAFGALARLARERGRLRRHLRLAEAEVRTLRATAPADAR